MNSYGTINQLGFFLVTFSIRLVFALMTVAVIFQLKQYICSASLARPTEQIPSKMLMLRKTP